MEFKDYYKILGVDRKATQDEIKRAYRKLARQYHPDVSSKTDAEARFKEVNEAHEALKDPEKRAAYDQLLHGGWQAGQGFKPPPGWDAGFEFRGRGFRDAGSGPGFSDFFESLFGRFGGGPGAGFRPRPEASRGEDHHARVHISLEDAYHGASRNISLQLPQVDAQGHVVTRPHTLRVKIPAGIQPGQKIRLAGQGAPPLGGGPAGDLYLEVLFEPHPLFQVEERDVHLTVPVTPWEAALGAKITVPTLGGRVELKIQPGSQSGQKLRLKGRGLPGQPPGDQIVTLQIHTPRAETDKQRRLYRELAAALPFNPRAGMN
ncbi:MAG TPA: J domain-containing protein [Gammaproteobacteria bacterium]|nr:J domain-containing protein [Gammaproteobacteria bacterium]